MGRAAWLLATAGLTIAVTGAGTVGAAELSPVQKQMREIYQELVETNTTDSVGSCTVAVTKMAKRLKAAGYKDADLRIVVPPGGPAKGNLVARLKGDGSAKPLLLLAHVDVGEANGTVGLFRLVDGGKFAERVPVQLGRTSVNAVEIRSGLNAGDKVIVSDMSRYDGVDRVRLE